MLMPSHVIAIIVTLYWLTVAIKVVFIAPRLGKLPNVLPKEKIGLLLRLFWAPTILAWIILPWCEVFDYQAVLYSDWGLPVLSMPSLYFAWFGAFSAFCSFILSLWSWRAMGQSWRIGIDPKDASQLVVSGPFRFVLHPIYSLSIVLMLSSFIVIPTWGMLIVATVHIMLLIREALREEVHLARRFPVEYPAYRKKVGRFFPKCLFF